MSRIIAITLIACLFSAAGCYYDNEEELYPSGGNCTTDNMSYSQDILPILQSNCYVCHSAAARQGNIVLEGHAALLQRVNSGQLLGAIKHQPGFSPMPQGQPQLSDCIIAKIESWVTDGALNN